MDLIVWLILPFLLPFLNATPLDTESDLPPYLKGFGWKNVEKELRKDLRLTSSVRPISYSIDLDVSVRGYRGAKRSTFDGSVLIGLNVSSTTDRIELHSVGLNIKKAELTLSSSIVRIIKTEYNRERETVIFTLAQPLQPTVLAQLKIHYNGTSQMRGIGLYESWTKNKIYSLLPTISLVSNCEPNGARRWFPSFDEPDKKATFRLRVVHPMQLSAYSNTAGTTKRIFSSFGLSETTFIQTVPLPTYVVALALSEAPVVELKHNGQNIRVIGTKRSYIVNDLTRSIDYVKSRPALKNITFIPEKTDWMLIEDFPVGAMENPGLITSSHSSTSKSIQIHELAHMYFGNLVTLRSWEQIWINEGFASYFQTYQTLYKTYTYHGNSGSILESASLHEPAMHNPFSYSRSQFTYNHFMMNIHVHYYKAAQLLSLTRRFIGERDYDYALNSYLNENSFGNGDSEMMINYLSKTKPDARLILQDWVYQAGVALLTVEREIGRVIIRQRRFIRTDFKKDLRDTKTRWTIPLYYKINGVEHLKIFNSNVEKLILNLPATSSFSIDESYPYLYAVQYKNNQQKQKIARKIKSYTHTKREHDEIAISKDQNEWITRFCSHYKTEQLWNKYLNEKFPMLLMCDKTSKSRNDTKRFLSNLIVTNELAVRNDDLASILSSINDLYPGILVDFLVEEHKNIDFLGEDVQQMIAYVAKQEKSGVEKLRNIVRVNPSFAANFYHMFTKIFEEDFIEREMEHFKPSIDDDFSYSFFYSR